MATETQHCCSIRSSLIPQLCYSFCSGFPLCMPEGRQYIPAENIAGKASSPFLCILDPSSTLKSASASLRCLHQLWFNGLKETSSFHSLLVVRDDERCSFSTCPCFSAAAPDAVHIAKTDTRTRTVLFAFSSLEVACSVNYVSNASSFKFPNPKSCYYHHLMLCFHNKVITSARLYLFSF